MRSKLLILISVLLLMGCVSRPDPQPAVMRDTPPPWDAPRDAISYIREAALPELSLGDDTDPWVLRIDVSVDGAAVDFPAHIGVDRLRAIQAPVHTHEPGGDVWLEGDGNRDMTLGHFFDLWGVRFDDRCLGAACGEVVVEADGEAVSDPRNLVLRGLRTVEVTAAS